MIENKAHFVLEYPLYNSIRDIFPSLIENVVLKSFKSCYRFDQQIDISFLLTKSSTFFHFKRLSRFDAILMYV